MNREETAAVLGIFSAAWPDREVPGPTFEVWCSSLRGVDPELGLRIAERLVTTEEWFPTITRFVSAAQAEARRLSAEHGYQLRRALPSPPFDRLRAKAFALVCKELMGQVGYGGNGDSTHARLPDGGGCYSGCAGCAAIDERVDEVHRWLIDQEQGAA